MQAIDFQGSLLWIDHPVLCYAVPGIQLALGDPVSPYVLGARRENLDNEIRSTRQPLAGDNLLTSFVTEENDIWNDAAQLS